MGASFQRSVRYTHDRMYTKPPARARDARYFDKIGLESIATKGRSYKRQRPDDGPLLCYG
jgi:hypothetical protein